MSKVLNVVLIIVVILLGYSNYQQGNKIAALYIKNAQLNEHLRIKESADKQQLISQKNLSTLPLNNMSSTAEASLLPEEGEIKEQQLVSEVKDSRSELKKAMASEKMQEMMQSDFMKQQLKYQLKNQLSPMYQDLIAELALDEEQAQKLLDLIIEEKVAKTQHSMSSIYQDDNSMEKMASYQTSESFEQQLEILIGENGVESYQAYENTLPVRQELLMFNAQVPGDLSLSSEQMSLMIDSMSQASGNDLDLAVPKMLTLIKEGNDDEARAILERKYDRALEQSASILSEQQQLSYQNYLNQQIEMQLTSYKMMAGF